MAEVVARACDLCGLTPASEFGVREGDGGEMVLDLCEGCAEEYIRPLLGVAHAPPAPIRRHYRRFHLTVLPEQPRERV